MNNIQYLQNMKIYKWIQNTNLSIINLIVLAPVLEHQQIKKYLSLRRSYYYVIGTRELVCTAYKIYEAAYIWRT